LEHIKQIGTFSWDWGGIMRKHLALCLAMLFAPSASSLADDTKAPVWKTVGEWEIRIDSTLGNGCFMTASYVHGDALRLGFNRKDRYGYMMFGNSDWKSLTPENSYPLVIQFGSNTPWNATARVVMMSEDAPFLAFTFSSPNLLQEFADSDGIRITYQGKQVSNLALTGSKAAVAELVNCQDYVDKNFPTSSSGDPFANSGRTDSSSDPFSH
jgi:hypothetical protein